MKYVFCSLMFDNVEDDIKSSVEPNTVSGHKFQENMLRGLIQNDRDVFVLNIPRVRHYPDYPKKQLNEKEFVVDGKCVGKSIGFNNRFIISYVSQYYSLKRALEEYINNNREEPIILLVFNSHLIQLLNMLHIRNKNKNVKICNVIGDLHGKYGLLRKNANIKERLVDFYGQIEDRLAKKCDYFVFLSKYMNEAINCKIGQYTVLEGMYNSDIVNDSFASNDAEEKVLLYAGTLDYEYDIEHLLNAFALTKDESFRLYIAGNGNYSEGVKQAEKKDSRIRYLGVLSPDNLLEYQKKADALISPRKNGHKYVKYSFPSKTMECLAMGKPFIAHKLDSEPDDYAAYIQHADEEDEALAAKISEVLCMQKEKKESIGRMAQRFILEEKNPKIMCKRIIDLCEGC